MRKNNLHQEKPCKNSFLAYLFFINICKITINFLGKRLEMSGGGREYKIFCVNEKIHTKKEVPSVE